MPARVEPAVSGEPHEEQNRRGELQSWGPESSSGISRRSRGSLASDYRLCAGKDTCSSHRSQTRNPGVPCQGNRRATSPPKACNTSRRPGDCPPALGMARPVQCRTFRGKAESDSDRNFETHAEPSWALQSCFPGWASRRDRYQQTAFQTAWDGGDVADTSP